MLWLTWKWNQKSCPRVTGAGFEGQCNANEQMWASKPCQLGRRAELTGDKEAGSALLPLNDSAEQKGKTTLWSSRNKAEHEWRLWFIVPVGQYRHVLERLSRGLQTPAEHTALQKASLQDGSEHVWSAGRHTVVRRLVTAGDWSRSGCRGRNRVSQPVREASGRFVCTVDLNKAWRRRLGTGSWAYRLLGGALPGQTWAHLSRILLDNGRAPFGGFMDEDWSQQAVHQTTGFPGRAWLLTAS